MNTVLVGRDVRLMTAAEIDNNKFVMICDLCHQWSLSHWCDGECVNHPSCPATEHPERVVIS